MSDELRYLIDRVKQGRCSRRAFLGRAGALGLTGAMANTMLAGALRAQTPQQGGHLVLGLQGGESTNSLDPALNLSQVPFNYMRQIGDTLLNIAPDGSLDMRLATEVDSSPDAQTWYFRIRQGVEFHDGRTMTPDDVLKTMQRHSDEESQSGALGVMRNIDSMEIDGDMLVVHLTSPNADLPYLMSDYHLVIQPNGGLDDPTAGIFTGPYRMVENEPGVRHVMEKFENYWDDSVGHFNSTEILVINDSTARNSALQSGQVQMINRVEPRTAGLLARAPSVTVQNVAGRGHYVFIMHCNTAPFDSNELRLALKYAIDREDMVEKILHGYGSIGNDMPINEAYPLFDSTIPQREFDPDRARHHYEQSGHDGSPIILRTAENAFPGAVDAAQLFQQTAQAAGIPLEIQREPADGYWSEVWNVEPFCASYWSGRPVQDQMYSTAYVSDADWNDTRFFREDFDALIVEARGELDETRRKELYREAGMMVRDEGGLICPMFNDYIDAHTDAIAGWEDNPNAEMMDGFAAVKCWQA
ncbi:peptide ABC transporter substrate-binding protein [Rhodobacteraceae bacterium WD3A24]|nr:peptide ABC transporter substrate-binding protein [Rhodobacteraceae bacterium WD3A24]